jgi:uracil-DNA glycosylase
MLKESGLSLQLEALRVGLNPPPDSVDSIEYLYSYTPEGDRRWSNLASYLAFMEAEQPNTLLIGEAPGYRGTSVSGVPFLSEGMIRHRQENGLRLPFTKYSRSAGYDVVSGYEATSTAMWDALDTGGARLPLLWAVFPNHPYSPGDAMTNRKPTRKEISAYIGVTGLLLEMYNIKHIVAVGNVAYDTLTANTDYSVVKLRHPARGGANKFREGLLNFIEATYGGRE